ncbi:MAG TPA: hypothetical protein VK401_05200 [Propionibacteriaceae bacterium]|nr:hypothetical protein [Propionibacteriaceae bacterium]
MARRRNALDRWARLLAPAERSATLLVESLRDPVEPLHPKRHHPRMRDRVLRLVRRLRRRLHR